MVDRKRDDELNEALELFHFAFRAFTAKPDKILESRGLSRVHHRILYFVARRPNLSVNALLSTLGVTKQALNAPLRQLLEMALVEGRTAPEDRRQRLLRLTLEGERLERALSGAQRKKLENAFERVGADAENGWRRVMAVLAEDEQR